MQFLLKFDQAAAVKVGLSGDEVILLSYFAGFFQIGRAKNIPFGGKLFWWITYNKMNDDLPILGGIRRLRRMMDSLEKRKLIERKVMARRYLYVWIDWDTVFGRNLASEVAESTETDHGSPINIDDQEWTSPPPENGFTVDNLSSPGDQNRLPIESYNTKNINITNERAREIDKEKLRKYIDFYMRGTLSPTSYGLGPEKMKIIDIADGKIAFEFRNSFAEKFMEKDYIRVPFEEAIEKGIAEQIPDYRQGG
jgi:hypothetical protein